MHNPRPLWQLIRFILIECWASVNKKSSIVQPFHRLTDVEQALCMALSFRYHSLCVTFICDCVFARLLELFTNMHWLRYDFRCLTNKSYKLPLLVYGLLIAKPFFCCFRYRSPCIESMLDIQCGHSFESDHATYKFTQTKLSVSIITTSENHGPLELFHSSRRLSTTNYQIRFAFQVH